MNRHDGFALITSLIILVFLASLGFAAMFLTDMNLSIAENSRSQAVARFNAEAGLDTSFVVLASEVKQRLQAGSTPANALPTDEAAFRETFPDFENDAFALAADDGYTLYTSGEVRVRVVGLGPRGAEYEAEALVKPVVSRADDDGEYGVFGDGFVSKGDIDMSGNGTYDISFFAGGNIDLRAATVLGGNVASATGTTCKFKWGDAECLTEQDPPEVPMPVFDDLRTAVITTLSDDGFDYAACPVAPATITFVSESIVCVPPGQSVTLSGDLSGLTVIGDETTTVHIDASTGDSTDDDVPGVTVVSGTVTFGSGAEFSGRNTIYALNDIDFGQNVVSNDDTARTFIATEGDFTLNGAGTSDIYASFWVGGVFRVNGTGDNFRSTVVANESIIKAGAGSFATLSAPVDLDFEYPPPTGSPQFTTSGIRVISRR